MLTLREMIKKSLLFRDSSLSTLPPNPDTAPKAQPTTDSLPKTSTERWNQVNLGYFDLHLDRAYGEVKIILVGKDVYYRNVVLFVQRLESLVIFKKAAFIKVNIATSLQGSALEWYTSELSNFDRNDLNNDPGVKNWVNILSHRFKVPTSVALGLLTNETYSLDNARAQRSLAQYVCAIMWHSIGCNIVNVANQLFFTYKGLAPEFPVFVSPPTESMKASYFIRTLEKKQEVWHEMLTIPVAPSWHYKNFCWPSPFRYLLAKPSLPSQSDAFFRY